MEMDEVINHWMAGLFRVMVIPGVFCSFFSVLWNDNWFPFAAFVLTLVLICIIGLAASLSVEKRVAATAESLGVSVADF